jgi:hypothetical protein
MMTVLWKSVAHIFQKIVLKDNIAILLMENAQINVFQIVWEKVVGMMVAGEVVEVALKDRTVIL